MKTYTTKDFYLTVLLMCNEFELVNSIKKNNGVHFELKNNNDQLLRQLIDQFINNEAVINMCDMIKFTAVLRKELDKHKKQ